MFCKEKVIIFVKVKFRQLKMKTSKRDRFIEFISGKEINFIVGIVLFSLIILGASKW